MEGMWVMAVCVAIVLCICWPIDREFIISVSIIGAIWFAIGFVSVILLLIDHKVTRIKRVSCYDEGDEKVDCTICLCGGPIALVAVAVVLVYHLIVLAFKKLSIMIREEVLQ